MIKFKTGDIIHKTPYVKGKSTILSIKGEWIDDVVFNTLNVTLGLSVWYSKAGLKKAIEKAEKS